MTLVRLDDYMADDLSVVNSARVSFGKYKEVLGEDDKALINFLMRERHGTPFEHNSFRFHVKCPIFVAREWFRHRIGSFNEFSARYAEVPTTAWTPAPEDIRKQVGKPGSYSFEPLDRVASEEAAYIIEEANLYAFKIYRELLQLNVAKEVARTVLPMGVYTEFYWTVNARSLMNFLSLRSSPHAQKEIREYASILEESFKNVMPFTYAAWVDNGRVAP
jgi:thymidylate synthase (FAD)